jgi:hypothetical protein
VTTEIAVANRWGIAIAADSAVTVEQMHKERPTEKVYNSGNKLFTLSKWHPVGVMIYNGMTLGGTPWETIVKTLRRELKDTNFLRLEEYCHFFFNSLSSHGMLFPSDCVRGVVERNVFRVLREAAKTEFLTAELDRFDLDDDRLISAVQKVSQNIRGIPYIEKMDENFEAEVRKEYSDEIRQALGVLSPNYDRHSELERVTEELVGLWFSRKVRIPGYSGVVISGFGHDDVFPKLYEYFADGIVCGRVRFWENTSKLITADNASFVLPFADSEVINTLLNGVSASFYAKFGEEVYKTVMALPELLLSQIIELNDAQKTRYGDMLKQSLMAPFSELDRDLNKYRQSEYVDPIASTLHRLAY